MSCFLCGHEKEGSHHLGCLRVVHPTLTRPQAVEMGLLPGKAEKKAVPDKTEILKEGTMTTVPVEDDDPESTVDTCEYDGCDNPKYSDHPRVKYCEDHKDPKNRKE